MIILITTKALGPWGRSGFYYWTLILVSNPSSHQQHPYQHKSFCVLCYNEKKQIKAFVLGCLVFPLTLLIPTYPCGDKK